MWPRHRSVRENNRSLAAREDACILARKPIHCPTSGLRSDEVAQAALRIVWERSTNLFSRGATWGYPRPSAFSHTSGLRPNAHLVVTERHLSGPRLCMRTR